jgi:lipoate-protein ligase A
MTNDPALLKLSLKASYAIFSGLAQAAFHQIGVSTQMSQSAGTQEYLRSPACFETHTPSDLLGATGQKIAGSAQLRRAGGILQHGAAFLEPYGVNEPRFFAALCQVTAQEYNQTIQYLSDAQVEAMLPDLQALQQAYCKSSVEILDSASTTSLSHLLPASF